MDAVWSVTKSMTKLAQRHSVWTSYGASYPTLRIYDDIWQFVMDAVWSMTKSENVMRISSWITRFFLVICSCGWPAAGAFGRLNAGSVAALGANGVLAVRPATWDSRPLACRLLLGSVCLLLWRPGHKGGQDTVCDWWNHLVNSQTARRRKGAGSLFMIVAGKFGRNATLEFEHRSAPTSVILARIKNEAELCGSTQVRASFFMIRMREAPLCAL
jgi:hypothetical protein